MDGCKSNFKDCLPQAKRECEDFERSKKRECEKKAFKMKELEEEKRRIRKITDLKKKELL